MPRVFDDPIGLPVNERRAFAEQSLYHFTLTYFGHHQICPYSQWHKEVMFPMVEDALSPKGRLVGQCPREHAKTMIGTTFAVIYAACKRLKKSIYLVLSSREDEGKNRLQEIVGELEANPLLKNDYGREIMPHLDRGSSGSVKTTAWRDEMVILGNGCQISAVGFGGKLRGKKNSVNFKRPDLFVLDDPENDQDVESELARKKAMKWVTGTMIPAMDEPTGSFIWLGTYLHFDSALWTMVHSKRFPSFDVQIIDKWTGQPDRPPDSKILWEEKWPWDAIWNRYLDIMADPHQGSATFFREYLGTPIDKSKQIFPAENWRYYPIENLRNENGRWVLVEGEKRLTMHTRIAVDPAISEGAQADYMGVIVSGILEDGRVCLLEILQLKQPISRSVHRIRQLVSTYKPLRVVVETNGYQAMFAQRLTDFGISVTEVNHRTGKEERIAAMAGNIEMGRVLLPTIGGAATSDARALIQQAEVWTGKPKAGHDDLLDSLCMVLEANLAMKGHHGLVLLKGSRQTPALTRSFSVSRDPKRDNPRPKIG